MHTGVGVHAIISSLLSAAALAVLSQTETENRGELCR